MTLYTQQNLYLAIPCIMCQCLHLLCYCCHRLPSTVLHHLNVFTFSVHFTIKNCQSTKLNCKKIITPLDVPATNHSNPSELAEVIVLGWQYPSTGDPMEKSENEVIHRSPQLNGYTTISLTFGSPSIFLQLFSNLPTTASPCNLLWST